MALAFKRIEENDDPPIILYDLNSVPPTKIT
jgi:hypothetical protein